MITQYMIITTVEILVDFVDTLSFPWEYFRSTMFRTQTRELTLALPSTHLLMPREPCHPQCYVTVKRAHSQSSHHPQVKMFYVVYS